MLTRIWLTIITSILLYIMYLPPCESGLLLFLFCLVYPYFCSDTANDFVERRSAMIDSPETSLTVASSRTQK
uniref:Uncharacterized protein n=1 Tax=Trichobilharzia regenti TaxID=157069 RepID=A0AA85IZQ1_TRIRE|nr:unnamed protein product [Trichobilharzia regenti]